MMSKNEDGFYKSICVATYAFFAEFTGAKQTGAILHFIILIITFRSSTPLQGLDEPLSITVLPKCAPLELYFKELIETKKPLQPESSL